MNQHKKTHALAWCILLFIIALIATPLIVSSFFLPSEIRLIVGEEHHFNFDLPLRASILKESHLIIKDDKDKSIEHQTVNLNKPLYVTMLEEGETDV